MRHTQCLLSVFLPLAFLAGTSTAAQEPSAWFAGATFGPVIQDRHGNDFLRSSGFVVQARAGRRLGSSISALLTMTHTSVPRRVETAIPMPALSFQNLVACPGGEPLPCGPGPFEGPVKAVVAGAGIEASGGSRSARVFASVVPGVYWLYQRAPGASPASAGIGLGAGGSVRLMEPIWLMLDINYHRIFSSGAVPRWLVPIGFGIQVR